VQPEEGAQEFESLIDVMVEEAVRGLRLAAVQSARL
jgi:hypothetical protein